MMVNGNEFFIVFIKAVVFSIEYMYINVSMDPMYSGSYINFRSKQYNEQATQRPSAKSSPQICE